MPNDLGLSLTIAKGRGKEPGPKAFHFESNVKSNLKSSHNELFGQKAVHRNDFNNFQTIAN